MATDTDSCAFSFANQFNSQREDDRGIIITMDFNEEKIQEQFSLFWKERKQSMTYRLNGKSVSPTNVSNFSIQLKEGDYGDGFNYKCTALNLRVTLNNEEYPFNAEFVIKVIPVVSSDGVTEDVVGIQDNRIYLKKK